MGAKKTSSKRANHEGTVYKNKRGLWIAQATIGYDENGKQIRKAVSGKTRTEAIANLAPFIPKGGPRKHTVRIDIPLKSHMQFWLLKYKKRAISTRTFERYIVNAKRYIYPYMGNYQPQDVSTDLLQTFLGEMLDRGYALDTVKHVKYQLRQYFEYCIDEQIIERNPADRVRLQARERKTRDAAEEQEYKAIPEELRDKFLQALQGSILFKPLCMTSMFAGLRIGEVLALRWKDFNEHNKTLSVVRAQTVETTFDENGNVIKRDCVVGKTKTAGSVRVLPIPDLLVEALVDWKKLRAIQELMNKVSLIKPEDFIFSTSDGKMRSYYGTNTMFKRFLKKHGLGDTGIHFYRLRHTFSNTLFEAQENPKVIQLLMGHKKVETTMIYNTATTNKYLQKAIDVFDERYASEERSRQAMQDSQARQPIGLPRQDIEPPTESEEKSSGSGDEFLQNIARLMNGYGVSSIDELIKTVDEGGADPKKRR